MTFVERVLTSFPLPAYVSMPAVGIDISDRSVKLIELVPFHHSQRVGRFATYEVPEGVIVNGQIVKKEELIAILSTIRKEHNLSYVRASLPEEPGYIFTTTVPDVSAEEIRSLLAFKLEEYVPLAPSEAIIDFDTIDAPKAGERVIAVSVFPQSVAHEYAEMLRGAGLTPVSLEIEAQAIARAVVPGHERGGYMTVDVGAVRSGITVVGGGAVRFTTTVAVGGEEVIQAIKSALPNATQDEIRTIKNTEGLAHRSHAEVRTALERLAVDLTKQIERYFLYWQTRKDGDDAKLPQHRIEKIFLSGGNANIAGLPEYISREIRVPVQRADVWANVLSIADHVPPIAYEDSLGYAASIGLALHRDN